MSDLNLQWLAENFQGQQPVIFDIGCACLSDDTLRMKYAVPNSKVYAFDCAEVWRKYNTETANTHGIHYFHTSVSDVDGNVDFYPSSTLNGKEWGYSGRLSIPPAHDDLQWSSAQTVKSTTLRTFCKTHNVTPDIIHIDAEGSEYKVFKAMGVQPKCIWTEIAEYRDDTAITFDKFNNLLLDYGYSLKYSNGQDALYVHNSVVFTEYNPTLNTDYEKEVQRHIWLARYKVVQAFEWPDLLHPGDFFNLPKSIQDECKKYNLTPSDEIL